MDVLRELESLKNNIQKQEIEKAKAMASVQTLSEEKSRLEEELRNLVGNADFEDIPSLIESKEQEIKDALKRVSIPSKLA